MAAPNIFSPTVGALSNVSMTIEDLLAQREHARLLAQMQAQKDQQAAVEQARKDKQQAFDNDIKTQDLALRGRVPEKPISLVTAYRDGTRKLVPSVEGQDLGMEPQDKTPASEPLETVIDPVTKKPVLRKRSQSEGMTPYERTNAPQQPRYSIQTMTDPSTGKDVLVRVNADDGSITPMDAGGLQPRQTQKAPTGAERQTRDYYTRMRQALDDMDAVESKITDSDAMVIQNSPAPDLINNALLSDAGKKYANALRSYTLAKLRKESGAAISAGEFSKEALTAARSRGDSPDVLAQKRNSRELVAEGFASSAGKAYDEFYGKPYERKSQASNSEVVIKTLKNGQKVRVTKTYPDGTFDGEPVP